MLISITPKNPASIKCKSKIPTSCSKMETSMSGASHSDSVVRVLNTKSRSLSATNVPAPKTRAPNAQKSLFEKKLSQFKKISNETKKDVLLKQKSIDKIYKETLELREKLISSGAEGIEEIDEITFTFVPAKVNKKKSLQTSTIELVKVEQVVESLKFKLEEIPKTVLEMCQNLLSQKTETARLLKEFINCPEDQEIILQKLEGYLFSSEDENSSQLKKMQEAYKSLVLKIFTEINKCILDIKKYHETVQENVCNNNSEHLEIILTDLKAEKKKNSLLTEKKAQLDGQMAEYKIKIKKLEEQVTTYDKKLQIYQSKNVNTEQSINDLKIKLDKQKEEFEIRLKEMKKVLDLKEKEFQDLQKEMYQKLEEASVQLADEINKRETAEKSFKELEQKYQSLEEKSKDLCELTCNIKGKSTDQETSEKEILLFTKLQKERSKVKHFEEQIKHFEEEKEKFVQLLENKSKHDDNNFENQLLIKIGENNLLNSKYEKLKEELDKMCVEKNKLEMELIDIKSRALIRADESEKDKLSLELSQLEQRTKDLEVNLTESQIRNKDLEKSLTLAQLLKEEKEREIKQLQKLWQKRNEVINLINSEISYENTSQKESCEETNKFRELSDSLYEKQCKIEHLKKNVRRLMEQETRAQKSRTNLETKIAMLEFENHLLKPQKSWYVVQQNKVLVGYEDSNRFLLHQTSSLHSYHNNNNSTDPGLTFRRVNRFSKRENRLIKSRKYTV